MNDLRQRGRVQRRGDRRERRDRVGQVLDHGVVGGLGGITGGVWAPLLREVRMSGAFAAGPSSQRRP